jgi:hypothetical protein
VEKLDQKTLPSLLEMYESAIGTLESREEPRLAGVIARLQRRREEVVAKLVSLGPPPKGG